MMKNNRKLLVILLGFLVPYVLIYKAFFLGGPLAWGDAPHFYPENLRELFNLPLLWNFKDNNFGAPQYYILWLYIPTFLYGALNTLFGLGNDFLIRFIFYFPATVLAIFGSWKLIGRFNDNIWGKFLGSFLYGFNTYILMLLDGGQVGVALAYGIFPLAAFTIVNYLISFNIRNFLFALLSLFALVSSDIRIALILVLFVGAIGVIRGKFETFKRCLVLGLSALGLFGYWIVPMLRAGIGGFGEVGGVGEGVNFISLSNALLLFQPHFPLNQFGMIFPTPFYFSLLPILVIGGLLLVKEKQERRVVISFSLLFLIFVFLAKGGSEPLGGFFLWIVSNIPLGVSFRDSSKFYIPLILTAAILLSFTVSNLKGVLKGKFLMLATIFIYVYLAILVNPALLGSLSGVLGNSNAGSDYRIIYRNIKTEENFGRSLWINEKPPLAYAGWESPAISADKLISERPFASINAGKDALNFINFPQTSQWFKLLGIKYVFLPGDERTKVWTKEGLEESDEMKTLVSALPGLKALEWPISFPAYEVESPSPNIFAQKKALAVLGGEDIYDRLDFEKSSLSGQGFIFLEEGRIDPSKLSDLNKDALSIIFNGKDIKDLQMSFLQKNMLSPRQAKLNQWQNRLSEDYLTWKYDLLKQGINSKEFDFGKGIAFSTVAGEKIEFNLPVQKDTRYYLNLRYTNATSSAGLKVSAIDFEKEVLNDHPERFKWETVGPFKADNERFEFGILNKGGFALLNTVILVSEEEYLKAESQAKDLTDKFKSEEISALSENFLPVKSSQINPTEYTVEEIPRDAKWLVFSDRYNRDWELKGAESLNIPFYAMVNGFYLPDTNKKTIYFSPQENVKPGILVSLGSLALIILGSAAFKFRRKYE